MSCRICTRCGKCGNVPAVPIREDGEAALPVLVPREGLGAAVDLGTTTVVTRVYDLADGRLVRQSSDLNPQRTVAADVMGRISAAQGGRLAELRDLARTAVRAGLGGLDVAEAVVVGNTTMLHLLVGADPSSFATAPFRADRLFGEALSYPQRPRCAALPSQRVRSAPRGEDAAGTVCVRLPRCAHAFFGADAVASVRMSGMCERGGCELLADIGTNGELALWRGDRNELTVTSVAAGPAFERPGKTGSEIIAAVADGLESGAIDETGLVVGELRGGLTQEDVRAVQLAKAAVFAGVKTLLAVTETSLADIARFSLAGGFGSGLDPRKAARIGLFPSELEPVVRVCGNLAIEGAAAALFDPAFGDETDALARRARPLELGGHADFADAFVSAMSFAAPNMV